MNGGNIMRRLLSLVLVVTMILALIPATVLATSSGNMDNFVLNGAYKEGTFRDVSSKDWYAEGVATAYELGLMKGNGRLFSPSGSVTLAEAITMAARLHSRYTTGKDAFVQGSPWYQVYVDYAEDNGILAKNEFADVTVSATRGQMTHIFASALPAEELQAINTVTKLPDVSTDTQYVEDIFLLYRAGVLTGNDAKGTFTPNATIQRSQAAAIIARMALPELRKTLNLQSTEAKLSDAVQPLAVTRQLVDLEAAGNIEPYSEHWFWESRKVTESLAKAPGLAYSLTFSDQTSFSQLPAGYDPDSLLEWGKYPGLNMDILHKHGFTGKGAVIAYVDQPASSHEQYNHVNIHYTNNTDNDSSMHGPAVLSLLAGKDIGTAPEAEIYYYGHASWKGDSLTRAECLYQIIEQNKSLPEGKKITMVGYSDNISDERPNAQAWRDAVAACEAAGIMVWFCGEYSAATFLPMSDKNDYHNLSVVHWGGRAPELVYVPSSGRTTAATDDGASYIYWSDGGLSWTMPYMLGLYAIAIEIDPNLTQKEIRDLVVDTAYDNNGMRIVNPVGFVATVLQKVGRTAEAKAMLAEVAARQNYLYAVMDTASMTAEDLKAVGSYLATITDATVLVADASSFSNAKALYSALQADSAARGGTVVGVQIFGTASMVPAFQVQYKVQMPSAVDEGGFFLTDLFYGNFSNDASRIAEGYNVLDHFAQGWNVDLIPDWPVARLPLAKGEFSAFFEKYEAFALETGLEQSELVNFSNPIFNSRSHPDDMGTFLNRMKNEFKLLDVDYRLYGNLDGDAPVTTKVLGGFTKENLAKENDAAIMELLINSHGQRDNIDQCIFKNGEEVRVSFLNMNDINSVLDGNAYYLDCWTCNNGNKMSDNLTTTALNGRCVGMFSATTIIANNGVDCKASLKEMQNSNFYWFYYNYLKALHEGKNRSQAFYVAQKAHGEALMECSTRPLTASGNYQFNLCNLLAYHNFGVLEPNTAAMAISDAKGYIAQAGQSVPKQTAQQGSGNHGSAPILTDGTPVGKVKTLRWTDSNQLQAGSYKIHSYTAQTLDNGYIRFTIEYTAPKNLRMVAFNPPDGALFKLFGSYTSDARESQSFDLKEADVRAVKMFSVSFSAGDNNRFFVFISTTGL